VNIKGKEIALFNIDGSFFALDNACTHEKGPLAEGDIEGHEVTCPWHGAKFDIRTGHMATSRATTCASRELISRSRSSASREHQPEQKGADEIHLQ
jgi:nitrite reductase/ring-hydroxylating ferredoxin subunit